MNFFRTSLFFVGMIALTVLPGCKKKTIQYTFQGHVTESVNQTALSGVNVEVSQRVYNGTVASAYFNTAGSATTASDGNYTIVFDRDKVFEFKIEMQKAGYFDFAEVIGSADVSTDEPKVTNHAMEPQSWVTFHLTNIGGMTTDEFTMVRYNFRTGCDGCTTNDYFFYNGIVDSVFTISSTGGVYARYSYKTPGSSFYQNDSVYMTPFDTVLVNLSY